MSNDTGTDVASSYHAVTERYVLGYILKREYPMKLVWG